MPRQGKTLPDCLAQAVRVLSVPPVMVAALTLILYQRRTDMFRSPADAIVMFVCLAVFPMLAYPLARLIPALRCRGREAERRLAMLLSAVGYAAACVYGFAAACGRDLMLVFMTYFLSVVGLLICNRLLRFRASGHSCAVTGPILLACRFLFEPDRLALSLAVFLAALLLWAVILWASLHLQRHTVGQLLGGAAVCTAAMAVSLLIFH